MEKMGLCLCIKNCSYNVFFQSDPFTRAPLTMDMVLPQSELKDEIEKWIEMKKEESQN